MKTYNLKIANSINLRKLKKPAALCITMLFVISIFGSTTARAAPSGVTTIFSSGFEDSFNSWTSTYGGVSAVSWPVYSGNYAMKCSDSWGSQATENIGMQSQTYTEAEFSFDKNFAGYQTLIAYFNAYGNPTVTMGLSVQSGRVFAFVEDKLPSYSYSHYELTGVTPGTWYKFALDVSATSATIYMNDLKLTAVSTTNIPATASVKIGMFWGNGVYAGNLYVDNVQVGSSSGSTFTPTPPPTQSTSSTSALSFSADQYVTKSIALQSQTYTEAEFSFDRSFAGYQTLIAYFNAYGNPTVTMGLSVQSGSVFAFVEDKLPSYSYSQYRLTGVTPGTWYKFALDVSATSATIYMNDLKLTAVSTTNIPATASVKIGMFWGNGVYAGNLYVDNVQVGSSSGSTSTYTPTPTPSANPTPTPAPTPIPTYTPTFSGNSLPLSAFGDDYLTWSNWNGDPNYWSSQLHWFTEYHCNTARLGFSFADDTGTDKCSTYSYAKMNIVLNYLSSVGVKAILSNFPGANSHSVGSAAWVNDWKGVASDFRGDTRIKAFSLCNEPYDNYLASNANTLSTFNAACASLIDQIRWIDPSRTIMYPVEIGIFSGSAAVIYNDLVAKGIPAKGNILYDITHPYYFEDYPNHDPVNDPVGDADWYWYNYALPQINYYGAANCYAGETFPWAVGNGGWNGKTTIHYDLQQKFGIRMVNYYCSVGMGFQMWCFFSRTDKQAIIDILNNSNYYSLIHS